MNKEIIKGFKEAKKITKKYAKTFYFASFFLDKNTRRGAYSIYAICRISDNSVDENSFIPKKRLLDIKNKIDLAYSNNPINEDLLLAFRETIVKYNIPKQYFDELISGMELDLTKSRYETFEDLYTYCYKVAGVIGLIMLKIFGYKNQEAAKYAVDLGIAMQLTNILRDIKEDCLRKRIYLPLNELNNFGVYEKDILNSKMNNNLESLLRFQLERAKKYYETSLKGVNLIDNKRAEFVVKLMANMYCAILDDIEKHNFDIFTRRAHTSILDKLTVLLKTFINN